MIANFVLLQQAGNAGGGGSSLIIMIVILVVMWILMLRPQRKREKEEQKFRSQLKKGDRVIFSGGIYGKICSVEETTVRVEVSNDVVVTVEKSMVQPVPEQKAETKK